MTSSLFMYSVLRTIELFYRSVERVQRSLSLGLQTIMMRGLGTAPGPVVFGYLMDRTCLLWSHESSGDRYIYAQNTIDLKRRIVHSCYFQRVRRGRRGLLRAVSRRLPRVRQRRHEHVRPRHRDGLEAARGRLLWLRALPLPAVRGRRGG